MKAYIDYDSLRMGKSALDSLYSEVHPIYVNKLIPQYEDLLKIDDNHDNCFDPESTNLYAINDQISQKNTTINEVSGDITSAINQFIDAELGIIKNIELLGNEYNVDDVTNINSKGLDKILLNKIDYYNDDLHGMYDKKPQGPLTQEEWNRQKAILQKLLDTGQTEREKAVIYATYMSTLYPNNLKYVMGGGHKKTWDEYLGLDSTWGYTQIDEEENYYMDCSAFVLRCLINGGYDKNRGKIPEGSFNPSWAPNKYDVSADVLKNQGVVTDFTQNSDVRAGDIVNISGGGGENDHVGIIIDINKEKGQMTVAHSSGSGGMNLSTINMADGVVIQDSNDKSREGKPYFQTVTRIVYEDEELS